MTSAKAEFSSMYGLISSVWKIKGDRFIDEIMIPHNTTATIILPSATSNQVMIDSQVMNSGTNLKMNQLDTGVKLKLGSGKYQFEYPAAGLKQ